MSRKTHPDRSEAADQDSTKAPSKAAARETDPLLPRAGTQQRFLDALQDLEAVVWEMDVRTWTFTYVSERAERMFGYPLERWTEPGFWQEALVDAEDRDWCTGYCLSAAQGGRDHAFIYRARAADGRVLWLKDVVRVIGDEGGKPSLLRGVMVDVTREHTGPSPAPARALDYEDPSLEDLRRIVAA